MPFLLPNQQRQSTEGTSTEAVNNKTITEATFVFYQQNNELLLTCCTMHLEQPVGVDTVNNSCNEASMLHVLHLQIGSTMSNNKNPQNVLGLYT